MQRGVAQGEVRTLDFFKNMNWRTVAERRISFSIKVSFEKSKRSRAAKRDGTVLKSISFCNMKEI